MVKQTKLLGAFALFGATLASCGSHVGLNRVSYAKELTKCADIAPVIAAFGDKQFKKPTEEEPLDDYYYDLFGNGSVTTEVNLKVTGGIRFYNAMGSVIDIPNANANSSDKITVEWSKDDDYIKITDSQSYAYIASEGSGKNKLYYKYFDSPVLGKVKIPFYSPKKVGNEIHVIPEYGISFENLVMYEVAYSNGYYLQKYYSVSNERRKPDIGFKGVGFDLSGFDNQSNYITPGMWFSNLETAAMIDEFTHASLTKRYAKKEDNSAALVNFKVTNLDLKELEDIYEPKTNDIIPTIESSGLLNADYFVAFENNFIRQHELILNVKDANVLYSRFVPVPEANDIIVSGFLIDLSNFNADIRISQDVVKDATKVDSSFVPADYLPLYY